MVKRAVSSRALCKRKRNSKIPSRAYFKRLAQAPSRAQRARIIRNLNNPDSKNLIELCYNTLYSGAVQTSPKQRDLLFPYRRNIARVVTLGRQTNGLKKVREYSANSEQRGGFIGALIATLAPIILEPILNKLMN